MRQALPIWITSVADRLDHVVTLAAMESARTTGRPVAACGVDLIPAALSAPPGRRCPNLWSCPGSGRPINGAGDDTSAQRLATVS